MKKISYLFILTAFVLFSSNSFAAKGTKNINKLKLPEWINNVDRECSKQDICAVGSGDTPSMAKTDARNNILKFFETSVHSKFKSSLSTDEVTVKSAKSEDLEETSKGILKGVNIKSTFDDGANYYAFATLNRETTTKEIRSDIDKIDSKMKLLIGENNIKYNKQLEKLYAQRDDLNKKYLVLTGNIVPEVVKYEDIFRARKANEAFALSYYFEATDGYAKSVSDYVSSLVLEGGAKVVSSEKNANRIIMVIVNKTNLHMGVSGFIKQMYSIKIDTNDISGNTISSLYQEFTETGRSEKQILELINIMVKEYISENIDMIIQ